MTAVKVVVSNEGFGGTGDNVAMNRIEKGRGVRDCRNPLSCDVMIKDVHLNRKERRH